MTYQELSKEFDFSLLGLEPSDNQQHAYCTPVDAEIFARTGVDGIHFCTIPAYGEMIFCVDPSGSHSREVFPLAEDWEDLLRMLLACGDVWNLVEADSFLDETEFWTNVNASLMEEERQAMLKALREKTGLEPRINIYEPLMLLRSGLDYSYIQYSDEYWEIHNTASFPPERWEVCFSGTFWGHDPSEQPGTEVEWNTEFDWAGKHWRIPAGYLCEEGLVLDLCFSVTPEEMHTFMEQYEPNQLEESPFQLSFTPELLGAGIELHPDASCSIAWTPLLPEEERDLSPEAALVVAHYGLDEKLCWMIHRFSFPWANGAPVQTLDELSLRLKANHVQRPGECFECHQPGGTLVVQHPITRTLHTITLLDCQPTQANLPSIEEGMEFPSNCYLLTCQMTPEPEMGGWYLQAVSENDEPKFHPSTGTGTPSCIGIIGGADGPTTFCFARVKQTSRIKNRIFPSSLHFALPERMMWRLFWHFSPYEEKILSIQK